MKLPLLLALAFLATPALAEESHLDGMAEEVLASEWADPTPVDDYLFEPIDFDDPGVQQDFLLDAAPLAAVQSVFGGTPRSEEIVEGSPVTWLCYETGEGRTSFASVRTEDGSNETLEAGPVLGLIVEEANAPANTGCVANPAAAAPVPGNDIPGLGATRADLESRFGSAPVDSGGHLVYAARHELGDEESWIESKIIYYRLEDGVVTGVAYRLFSEH